MDRKAEIATKCHLKQAYMPGLSLVTLFHAHYRVLAKTDFEEQSMQSPKSTLFVEIYPGLPKIKKTPPMRFQLFPFLCIS